MQAGERVGIFLKRKLQENNLKRSHVAKEAGISPYVISSISNNKQNDISLKTVLRFANYFNCSTDEVLGRNYFTNSDDKNYLFVTSEEAMNKIRNFIKTKFEESGVNISKFSKNCGSEEVSIREFIKDGTNRSTIFTHNILIIVNHFNISIDELIGRSSNPNKSISNNVIKTINSTRDHDKTKNVSQTLPSKDAAILNEIQQEIKEFHNEIKQKINTLNRVKTKVKDNSQSR